MKLLMTLKMPKKCNPERSCLKPGEEENEKEASYDKVPILKD